MNTLQLVEVTGSGGATFQAEPCKRLTRVHRSAHPSDPLLRWTRGFSEVVERRDGKSHLQTSHLQTSSLSSEQSINSCCLRLKLGGFPVRAFIAPQKWLCLDKYTEKKSLFAVCFWPWPGLLVNRSESSSPVKAGGVHSRGNIALNIPAQLSLCRALKSVPLKLSLKIPSCWGIWVAQ